MIAAPPPKAARKPPAPAPKPLDEPDRIPLPWLDNVQVASAAEAAGLRDNLISGLESVWKGMDELITFTNKLKADAYIWQLTPTADTEYIVDTMLTIAQRVPAAAAAVRALAQVSHQLRIGMILMPKFMHMWQFYATNGGFAIGGF